MTGPYAIPHPVNEPVLGYAPGSAERSALERELDRQLGECPEIPVIAAGRRIRTGRTAKVTLPHDHGHVLALVHQAGADEVALAIEGARKAFAEWSRMPYAARAAILLKAADLLAGPWRQRVNAATMLNQSKTCLQAEIDSACELIDFWRFNPAYGAALAADQPHSPRGVWNTVEHRALEGYVFAVTPFNFTSIAGNLPTAPALMGNVVLWKPASTALWSGYQLCQLLEEAGMPPGVISFLPGRGGEVGDPALDHPDLAGVHFTGSTRVFQGMWQKIGSRIANYRSYPRIVGETGGKDFIFVHPSADLQAAATAAVRGAFEYQGQKCSAASRLYAPKSTWNELRERICAMIAELTMGNPRDFRNFMAAVIDKGAFESISGYQALARSSPDARILAGGKSDGTRGWFVEPTLVEVTDPRHRLMAEEIFGPILTVFVYDDSRIDDALELVDTTSPYALTGAIFANDRSAILAMAERLRYAAGNFYINDKPTGAVVGQQPFGGARASGTNDKAGSMVNLLRWTNLRAIKETFAPPVDFRYPHMGS